MMSDPDVTVLVPLHRSAPFVPVVEGNLRRLAGRCRLVVSDAEGVDASLARLRQAVGDREVTWLGPRPIPSGWIGHYNDLLSSVTTPYFMWLPHDDEIDPSYLESCRAALEQQPGAIAATGVIDCIEGPGLFEVEQHPLPPPVPGESWRSEANRLLFRWNLGIAFRAVFRTAAVLPISATNADSEWADIVWLYGVGLDGAIVQVEAARYRKRFYDTSTHATWRRELHPHALPHLVREIGRRPSMDDRAGVLDELVAAATDVATRRIDDLSHQLETAGDRIDQLTASTRDLEATVDAARLMVEDAHARARAAEGEVLALRASRSWRAGRALAWPVRALRRRARGHPGRD